MKWLSFAIWKLIFLFILPRTFLREDDLLSQAAEYKLHTCQGEISRDTSTTSIGDAGSSKRLHWIQDSFHIHSVPVKGKVNSWIRVRIRYIRLPITPDCLREKLVVFAGKVSHRPDTIKYCGHWKNMDLLVKSPTAVIRFEGHISGESNGFSLEFHCVQPHSLETSSKAACLPGEYSCLPKQYVTIRETICLDAVKLCDGICHCPFGDDEWARSCSVFLARRNVTQLPAPPARVSTGEPLVQRYQCAHRTSSESNQSTTIDYSKLCDGVIDCPQGDDELCFPGCEKDQFKCFPESKACLPKSYLCDNQKDCESGLDEKCEYISPSGIPVSTLEPFTPVWASCSKKEFTCHLTRTCVHEDAICDGIVDCPNGEDEAPYTCAVPQCPFRHEFYCSLSSVCIDRRLLCDGQIDCAAGEDETKSTCTPYRPQVTTAAMPIASPGQLTCPQGFFLCKEAARCIPNKWVCDGYPDCSSAEDELPSVCQKPLISTTISPKNCTSEEFYCPKDELCIPMKAVCDKINDCSDGFDESQEVCYSPTFHGPQVNTTFQPETASIKCGMSPSNISSNQPWLMLVSRSEQTLCTGVLSNNEWVLIAPNCTEMIKESFSNVTVTAFDMNNSGMEQEFHFNVTGLLFDNITGVGAVRIPSQSVPPVCLAPETTAIPPTEINNCYIMGWGIDGNLTKDAKAVKAIFLPSENCSGVNRINNNVEMTGFCVTWVLGRCMPHHSAMLLCQSPATLQWKLHGTYFAGGECSRNVSGGPMFFIASRDFTPLLLNLSDYSVANLCAVNLTEQGMKNYYNLEIIPRTRFCALLPISANWLLTQASCVRNCTLFGGRRKCRVTSNVDGVSRPLQVLRSAYHALPGDRAQELILLQVDENIPTENIFCVGKVRPSLSGCIVEPPRALPQNPTSGFDLQSSNETTFVIAEGTAADCQRGNINATVQFSPNGTHFQIHPCNAGGNETSTAACSVHAAPMFCTNEQNQWRLAAVSLEETVCNGTLFFTVLQGFVPFIRSNLIGPNDVQSA